MDITLISTEKPGYLLIVSVGSVDSANDLFQHSMLIYQEVTKYPQKKVLIDCTGMRFSKQFFSYIELANHYVEDFPADIKTYKIAAVGPEEYKEIGSFWETIVVNRGFQYHAFILMEDALDWLL